MTQNQNRYNNAINQMSEMSNFGCLPTVSSRSSSATPGPPPFHITRTPLFIHRDPYYGIHPATLREINHNANDFDTDHSSDDREGYVKAYDTFSIQSNGATQFTHRTHVAQPLMNIEFNANPIEKAQPGSPSKASPSLLRPSMSPPITKIAHYPSIIPPNDNEGKIYDHEASWMSELGAALNRMGINQTTTILIIVAVFFAVQINQYNYRRNAHHSIANDPLPNFEDVISPYITKKMMHDLLIKREKEFANKLDKTYITEEMMVELLRKQEENCEKKLNETKQSVIEQMEHFTEKSDQIEDSMRQKADISAVQPAMKWFEARSTTNWISGISKMPETIPYSFNEHKNSNASDNDKKQKVSFNLFKAMIQGIKKYHNETKGSDSKTDHDLNEQLANTANLYISAADTPETLRPADCLQFNARKEDRWIEIDLIERIVPTAFEYVHIKKEKLQMEDRNKSPKRFMLFGKIRGGNWSDIAVKEDKILEINESIIKLTLDTQTGIEMMRIEYDINPEAKTTRIYRMKVYGEPDVYQG